MLHTPPSHQRLEFPKNMFTPSCSSCSHKQVAPCRWERVQALSEFRGINTPSHSISAEVLLSVENVRYPCHNQTTVPFNFHMMEKGMFSMVNSKASSKKNPTYLLKHNTIMHTSYFVNSKGFAH